MKALTLKHRFSIERAFLLLRNRLFEEAPTLGIGLAVIAVINALGLLLSKRAWFNQGDGVVWGIVIMLSGAFLAATAFKGMHDGKAGTEWLLLPASPAEKFAAAAVDYLIVFPLVAILLSMGLSSLLYLIERALSGPGGSIWTPDKMGGLKVWLQYVTGVSLFLAGSAGFRKASFLKTLAVAFTYVFVMAVLFFFVAYLMEKSHGFDASHFTFNNGDFTINGGTVPKSIQDLFNWACKIAWNGLLPLFALAFGYFRVFEKEARDEVQ